MIKQTLESFRSMADRFGVAKSTYHFSVKKVVSALATEIIPNVKKGES
jgi:predicted DNA binding protein